MFKLLSVLLWPVRQVSRFFILAYERWPAASLASRTPEQQTRADADTAGLVLYHMESCPYCVKVRKHAKRLGLTIPMRDIKLDKSAKDELVKQGGQFQVPCLWIPAQGAAPARWMYESSDINAYLSERFGA